MNSELQGLKQEAIIFPLVFLGVAAMVLNVVMTRLTEKQRVIIGTLKAIGLEDRPILTSIITCSLDWLSVPSAALPACSWASGLPRP